MSFVNFVRRTALAAGSACMLMLPGVAYGLDAGGTGYVYSVYYPTSIKTCETGIRYNTATSYAYVNMPYIPAMAGGTYWNNGTVVNYSSNISASQIKRACGFASVTNVVAIGATTGSYATDPYIGISYDAVKVGETQAYHYEYAISGATNSRVITSVTLAADSTPPTVSIGALSGPTNGVYTAAITISETTTDFIATDLKLTNSKATLSGSGTSYTATLTPIAQGTVGVSVDANKLSDAAGNFNTVASNTVTATFDSVAPKVKIGSLSGPLNGVYTAEILVSETTTDFIDSDLSLTNATATLSGSGTKYTATLTPITQGKVGVSVGINKLSDAAGNFNTVASNAVSAIYDSISPSVKISGAPASFTGATSFAATFTFTEDVIGFEPSDIVATNASVTNLTGSGASYTATIAATGNGDVVLSLPAGMVTDEAGNGNTASSEVNVVNETVNQTQEVIATAMHSRATALIASQPKLSSLLTGEERGNLDVYATKGNGQFDLATNMDNPVWLRANGSWSTSGTTETQYAFGVIGSHYKFSDDLLIGAMIQLDYADTTDGLASVTSSGWLAGPYVVARLKNQPLILEASLLYGETSNDISPLGTYTDSFETERMLATAAITGEVETERMTLYPNLRLSHTMDTQKEYTDALSNVIASQSITLSELSAGIDFSMPIEVASGEMSLTGGVSGIWSQTSSTGSEVAQADDSGRARVDLGLSRTTESGLNMRFTGYYDGIGAQDYEAYGLDLLLDFTF